MIHKELGNVKRVLDLGCGVGRLSEPLSKYYEITGIDINQKFLDAAPKNKKKQAEYIPAAVDADGDGLVQDGTIWERPVGTELEEQPAPETTEEK